ncbi:898e2baa-2291-4aa0-bb4b-2a24cf5a774f [Sclerotinia trifoliorum]|uniref:898e2baa-2291-4aa0-bb4b-2a24cf5a774f n=1 Tax=Sclerotinia trifoliorum TaxID=28548 RepID=A0A8H2W1X3_9HELO|nr:898e2baa-2291-4aa0-bb4b-2a24cf5a774f [Sclerotinia trifoliorum]
MLRQTSGEAEGIFDFILALHGACDGKWGYLLDRDVRQTDIDAWLEYAGMFLSSLGNCFDDGNRKVIPSISHEVLRKMASVSPDASAKLEEIITPMVEIQPAALGYPDGANQSGYYISDIDEQIKKEDIEIITKMMEARKISPENTRLRKLTTSIRPADENIDVFEILQASAEKDTQPLFLGELTTGDNRRARRVIYKIKIAATNEQKNRAFPACGEFRSGDYNIFRSAHKTWVTDKNPRVEHCWVFYSGIAIPMAMIMMVKDPSELYVPNLAVIHVLASIKFLKSSSYLQDDEEHDLKCIQDDDGKRHGVKNMVCGNRMNLNSSPDRTCYYIHPSEVKTYMTYAHKVRFVTTAIHELIGHGTGKLLAETIPGKFNFDHENPPTSPLTGKPIQTWYKPGQTWNSVFGKLAATVEECRAFLIANYLADNKEILALFGYDQESTPTADEFIYYTYLQIGVEGLRALRSYKVAEKTWGSDHDQAQFTILKHLHQTSKYKHLLQISHDAQTQTLRIHLNCSKLLSDGKPSLGRMLRKLHIWRCTADIEACRSFYEEQSVVDGEYEEWRKIVAGNMEPKWKFVQGNRFWGRMVLVLVLVLVLLSGGSMRRVMRGLLGRFRREGFDLLI